ncbi:MAG: hypothetical protein ACXABG_07635 [Promethearchaeota archaeon]|jgi:hypothetical protein
MEDGLTNMYDKYAINVKEGTFAEAILKIYSPLNSKEKFKETFADANFKILLNPIDGNYAALISVEEGELTVEGIENSNKYNFDRETLGWDGFIQTTLDLFKEIGEGNLSQGDIAKKMVTRKIKIKNVKMVAMLSEIMTFMDT